MKRGLFSPILLMALTMAAGAAFGQELIPPPANNITVPETELQMEAVVIPPPRKYIVVIDPGHGGLDLGVRSSKSILEKSVALKLAFSIRSMASKYPNVNVYLTREGDLERTMLKRLELANSNRADLFLSIHTGGGFAPQTRPMEIFIAGNKNKSRAGEWGSQNWPYRKANYRLANSLSKRMAQLDSKIKINIVETGGMMLEGLAMPAAVIEPVDLSNPQDEILLEESKRLRQIASAITRGIIDFLDVKEPVDEAETSDE
ncbi:MAG: N-acetylmuramoyl-L-alanine amidase [Nitrospinota bacterium]|nr:N-acetylmuramoyl-L-alanine amidase [Nitrospinota bacterium]